MKSNLSYGLMLAIALAGCGHLDKQSDASTPVTQAPVPEAPSSESLELERPAPQLLPGNDQMVRMPPRRAAVEITGEAVALNFEQAPLLEVVHAVLGDILELDYIIEHPIGGEVTLRTRTPVPRDQLLVILESLLQANNAYMVRDKQDRYIVSGSAAMAQLRPEFSHPASQGAGYANVIVPLNYIGANEMAEILRPVADEKAFVRIDSVRNLLVLAGRRNQLDGWLDIVATFDVDMLKGMSVGLFPLKESSPAEAQVALRAMLETALGEDSSVSHLVRIVPMERLNSLMIITPREHYLEKVREWLDRIDQAPDDLNGRRLFVYSVQNTSASHLARLMSSVFGGAGGGGSSGAGTTGVAPGMTPARVGEGAPGAQSAKAGTASNNRSSNTEGTTSFNLGEVRVVADEENNSLLIYASGSEYQRMVRALQQLDILPTQVSIEASILEITLSEELSYGLAWYLNNSYGSGWSGKGALSVPGTQVTSENPSNAMAGLAYSVFKAGELRTVINALADKSLVNIISTPSVTVLDNHQASIQVGNEQPVQSGRTVTDGGVSSTSITYRDTGVVLDVTPSVNAGGMVTMLVKQSITDVGDPEPATGQRPFLKRDISTRVAVRSGEAAVLGGLIRENAGKGRVGVPFLSNLPIVGNFFGRTTNTKNRTELLVMITPRVIASEQDFRDVTREMQERMQGLKLINYSENLGSSQPDTID